MSIDFNFEPAPMPPDDDDDDNDWLSPNNFNRYIRECRSGYRTDSTSAWVTFFRVINRKPRKPTKYDDALSNEMQPNDCIREACAHFLDAFSASSLSRYPWRLAVAELVLKFDLDVKAIAKPLGLLVARLESFPTWKRATDQEYKFHTISKKTGGARHLHEPTEWLKSIQRNLYHAMRNEITPHPASHGFERGRSILSNAQQHTEQLLVVRFDIKQAFENTSKTMVENTLRRDLHKFRLSDRAIAFLGELFTYRGFLPTGAPSSPFLLNRVLLEADIAIMEAATRRHVNYSRYADDLILSGQSPLILGHIVRSSLGKLGYQINEGKNRVYRKGSRQIVTGLVVNDTPNLPRETRKNLRAATHSWATNGSASWKGTPLTKSVLQGHLDFYFMISPMAAERLRGRIENAADS